MALKLSLFKGAEDGEEEAVAVLPAPKLVLGFSPTGTFIASPE